MTGNAKVLIAGSGGREHALAWSLAQSPRVAQVWVAPGNGGTDARSRSPGAPVANVPPASHCPPSAAADLEAIISFAQRERVDLVVIGPEAMLAGGFSDACRAAGLRCFAPSRAAARLETSKAYAKDFMARHGIPTASYAVFDDYGSALAHLRQQRRPVVVKASGLAAGKGVIVPETPREAEAALGCIMLDRAFGAAGDEVVIEERLSGREVSLLAFSDGETVRPMPPAQDHKRAFDGDAGPNTGGMGVYAPVPWLSASEAAALSRAALDPVVKGLHAEGTPYVGVLYAGLMMTGDGPKVLEYNCRFGDPETQALLPLLESDLLDVLEACADGRLAQVDVRWRAGAAVTVILASHGYPGEIATGRPIRGVPEAEALPGTAVFQAGTRWTDAGQLVTAGGRVLAVTGAGDELPEARRRAYQAVSCIQFEGMHFRTDIGGP